MTPQAPSLPPFPSSGGLKYYYKFWYILDALSDDAGDRGPPHIELLWTHLVSLSIQGANSSKS